MKSIVQNIVERLMSFIPGIRPYPKVLQFPITGRCNSQCGTCSVPSLAPNLDMTVDRVREIMKNDLFKKLTAIGVNGGEPSLVMELPKVIDELLTLPKLQSIHMISNGMLTDRILTMSKEINARCKEKGVLFSLSISLDGIDEVYWACRGVSAFTDTMKTIDEIVANPGVYCATFSAGCTVSRYNVDHLVATDAYCTAKGIPIFYRIAVPNRRIYNLEYSDDFSVLSKDADRRSAMEFFYGLIVDRSRKEWKQKFTYYVIFKYLEAKGNVRMADCFWKWRDATVDESGNIYYCATQSKCLGTLNDRNAKDIFFAPENLQYRKELINEHCQKCIHYVFSPSFRGLFGFVFFFAHLVLFPVRYRSERRFF